MHTDVHDPPYSLLRATLCLLVLSFTLFHCGSDPVVLLSIDSQRVPAATVKLLLRSRLNGTSGEELRYDGSTRRIAVYLPPDSTGDLKIDMYALDGNDCKLAIGSLSEPVPVGLSHSTERSLTLTTLPGPLCTLKVTIDSGTGTVTSSPPGINCTDTDKILCGADFTSGTTVTLTATTSAPASPEWMSPCMGQMNTCPVALVRSQEIHLAFTNM